MSVMINGIVVAKSRKNRGYCLVVFDLQSHTFYRIVSDNPLRTDGEVTELECTASNGQVIENLNVINIYVKSMNIIEDKYQKENLILDPTYQIEILETINKIELIKVYGENKLNSFPEIFKNAYGSMCIEDAASCLQSFMMVKVFSLSFYSIPNKKGELTCKCSFKYNGIEYTDVSVTISKTKDTDIRKYSGRHYPNGLVCFSFGHPYEDKCFKYMCSFLGVLPYFK